ncbi:MAG: D-alanine--D-alanine ligase [Pseudohongiellaceae bacterium]
MNTVNINELTARAGRVAVLYGGTSAEREISLLSGQAVITGLRNAGMEVVPLDVGKDLVSQLLKVKPDRVFNVLHGRGGEDGVVQGLLEFLRIPYTGSGVLGSALSMDKVKSKLLWQGRGISTAEFVLLDSDSDWTALDRQFGKLVVKPVNEGSSIGMTITDSAAKLERAYLEARKFDPVVMAEKYIDGQEYTVAILGRQVLPAIQLGTDHEFYDFNAKYIADDTRYVCPVDLAPEILAQLNQLALDSFTSLGCEGWGRADIMRDRQGCFYVLEINTVPGMTSHSLAPMAAKAAGINFEELVVKILFAKEPDQKKGMN